MHNVSNRQSTQNPLASPAGPNSFAGYPAAWGAGGGASPLSPAMLKIQGAEADHSFWFETSGSTPVLGIADIFDEAPMTED